MTVSLNRDERAHFTHGKKRMSQPTNLEYLVLFLKVFVLIRVTLGKLVDVDPELLDLLSDLEYMYTLKQ